MERCIFQMIVLTALVIRQGKTGHPCDPVGIAAWPAEDVQLSSSVEFSITVKDKESCHKGRPNCYSMEILTCKNQETDFVSFGPQYHAKKCIVNPGCISLRCGNVVSPPVEDLPGILPQLDVACKAFRNSSVFSLEMESDERARGWTVYLRGVNHSRIHGVGSAPSIPGKPNTVWIYGDFKWEKCYDIHYAPMLETEDTDCNRVRHYDSICYNETTVAANLPPFCIDGPNSPKKNLRTRMHRPSTRITPNKGSTIRTNFDSGVIDIATQESQKPVIIQRIVPVYSPRARLPILFGEAENKPLPNVFGDVENKQSLPSHEYMTHPEASSLMSPVIQESDISDMARSLSSTWSSNTDTDLTSTGSSNTDTDLTSTGSSNTDSHLTSTGSSNTDSHLTSTLPTETALLPTSYTLVHRTTINGKPIERPVREKNAEESSRINLIVKTLENPIKGKSTEDPSRTDHIIDKTLLDNMVDPEKYRIFAKKRMFAPTAPPSKADKMLTTKYLFLIIPLLLQWVVN